MLPFFLLRDAKRVVIDRGIQIDDTRNEVMPFIQQLPHVPIIAGGRKQIPASVEAKAVEAIEDEDALSAIGVMPIEAEVYEVPEIAPKRGRKKAQPNQ